MRVLEILRGQPVLAVFLVIGLEARGPAAFADTSPAALLPTGARVVMISGEFDHVMPPATGRAYVARLTKAGDAGEAIEIPGVGHAPAAQPLDADLRIGGEASERRTDAADAVIADVGQVHADEDGHGADPAATNDEGASVLTMAEEAADQGTIALVTSALVT